MHPRLTLGVLSLCAIFAAALPAQADPIDYGDYFGLNPSEVDFLMVREDSATDNTPLYGMPIRQGNQLIFSPLSFASFAGGGSSDVTIGALSMRIRADMGQFLETISIRETGNASLLGGFGTSATAATITGLLTAVVLDPATGQVINGQLTADPPAPYALPEDTQVLFNTKTHIDLTGMGIREVVIVFSNALQTTSEPGTAALIQKTSIIIDAPEPTTLVLLLAGGTFVLRRRRR